MNGKEYHKLESEEEKFYIFEEVLPGIQKKVDFYLTMLKVSGKIDLRYTLRLSNKKHKPKVYRLSLINNDNNKKVFTLYYEVKKNLLYYRNTLTHWGTLITTNEPTQISSIDELTIPFESLFNYSNI